MLRPASANEGRKKHANRRGLLPDMPRPLREAACSRLPAQSDFRIIILNDDYLQFIVAIYKNTSKNGGGRTGPRRKDQ
jgi:hypothetical protein